MFNNIYKGKKVLVTGHTGFKGAWLCMWLLKLDAEVHGISIDVPTEPSLFEALHLNDKITDHRMDVRNLEGVKKLIHEIQPDFIFHLAAQPIVSLSYSDPIQTFSTNIMGTAHVLESLRTLEKFCTCVIITSDKCYDNVEWVWGYRETDRLGGKDIYSGSKGAAEIVFNSYFHSFFKNKNNIRLVSARAGNVIGGGDWAADRIVPDCIRAWKNGGAVSIRSPKATRPWQHVLEPLSGYLLLGQQAAQKSDLHGESFNFGPDAENNHSVLNLLNDLSKYWNFSPNQKPYNIIDNIPFHEAGLLKLNCDKALFYLKWLPTLTYDELTEMTSAWYYSYYHEDKDMYAYTSAQINQYESLARSRKAIWID